MTEPDNHLVTRDGVAADEIELFDVLIVLAKYKWVIFGFPLLVAVVVAGYTLTMTPIYTGSTKMLPPQQSQSASTALLAQLGGLANLVGGSGAVGVKSPNDLYIAMLGSRTVADNLIQRFELMKLWEIDPKFPSEAYERLAVVTDIKTGKDGLITIEVEDKDPKRAADLANAYVDELIQFTGVLAVTEASKRRLFFERQFSLAKDNLSKAESLAREALQTGGLVKVDDQGRAMVETTARLRGQITVKEVQIGAMRAFAADANPNLQLALQELDSMKRELAKIEGAGSLNSLATMVSSKGNDSLRLLRDVKYHEVIFELLAKQFEMAKIDEAKDSAIIQVMDRAIVPDRKSKPRRKVIVLLWTVVAGIAALLWAFGRESIVNYGKDPKQSDRLRTLKHYLQWRKVE